MDITYRQHNRKWIAEVWNLTTDTEGDTLAEQEYQDINQWCIDTFGYHARTAYHVFEFKQRKDLEFFVLRWA
jgi:hypothetical protein